ncbi:winged helix-turn-helix transcriptional regulator [Methanoculleus sp.]|uniref:winged helix-turn-helix transcriptional regulator n=1 Tax=Methanoculleus sp. TaxID=90427 RepID=UPI001BD5DFA3|nr:winged helix-turn-helix transcriptional regulator [Methanoculleus sp.]
MIPIGNDLPKAVMLTLAGLTQKEIGDRVGTSQSAVSYRLRGTGYDIIQKIIEWYRSQIRERVGLAEKIDA